jgi:hypothetical protein
MKSLVCHGPGKNAREQVTDVVVLRVGTTTICGDDLPVRQRRAAAVAQGRLLVASGRIPA